MQMQNSEKRQKAQNKPNAIKVIMALRRNQRSTTEQKEPACMTRTQCGEQKQLLQLIQKSKDFSSIFTKHKRSEYSGYKQVNMNKSKIIRFQHEHKQISRYQTPRKYQMNLKNIAKLRKRYSLEPTHFKESSKYYKKYFLQSTKSRVQGEGKYEQFYSDRRCEKELKEIIRQMNTSKHFSAERNLVDSGRCQNYAQKEQNRLSTLKQNILYEDSSIQTCEKNREIGKYPLKLTTLQTKKSTKHKLKYEHEQKQQANIRMGVRDQQENLCGWQTQSFYPKKKRYFFDLIKS